MDASYRVLCWVCLLLVRRSLFRLPDLARDSQQKRQLATRTDECADLINTSLQHMWELGGGLVNKVLGVRAPIYFVLKWLEERQEFTKLQQCQRLEAEFRAEVPFLDWDFLLPCSLSAIYLLA